VIRKRVGFPGSVRTPLFAALQVRKPWTDGRVIPHAAWYSSDGPRDCREKAARTVIDDLTGGPLRNRVNEPYLKRRRLGGSGARGCRIADRASDTPQFDRRHRRAQISRIMSAAIAAHNAPDRKATSPAARAGWMRRGSRTSSA
jgi:hypothetical protein